MVLDRAKAPVSDALWMLWALATRPGGVSSVEAARETGLSRMTSQHVLGVLRQALDADERNRVLSGVVEVDETYVGGHARDTN